MKKRTCSEWFRDSTMGRTGMDVVLKIGPIILHVMFGLWDEISDYVYYVTSDFAHKKIQ